MKFLGAKMKENCGTSFTARIRHQANFVMARSARGGDLYVILSPISISKLTGSNVNISLPS